MMKEIHEQPKAVQDTLNSVIKDNVIDFSNMDITSDEIANYEQIYIVACGSAWHVTFRCGWNWLLNSVTGKCRCTRIHFSLRLASQEKQPIH